MKDVSHTDGVAIGGFDTVAYFNEGRAIEGNANHAVEHAGASWLFSSEEHATAFKAAPERYVPAYLGHCAFATSLGKTEAGNPRRWSIRGGRLFLNSNAVAHQLWKLIPGRVPAADRKWAG